MKESVPFIKTLRSGITETIHRVSVVAIQDGSVIYRRGDPNEVVSMRSTSKPFMLTPLLMASDKYNLNLTDAQICIMASSHNGEPIHRECVLSILSLCNLSPNDLKCGTHLPFYGWLYADFWECSDLSARQLFHNCAGKHAGMLLLCELLNVSTKNYWLPDHPIQKLITASIKEQLHISEQDAFSVVKDGCGVPTYAISIYNLAMAYQNICLTPTLEKVYGAIMSEPYMIAGRDRIDTRIIEHLGYIAKSGSDGLFCVSCPKQKIGIALKIESGDDNASEAAVVEVLDQLGLLPETKKREFDKYRFLQIRASNGELTGHYCPIYS